MELVLEHGMVMRQLGCAVHIPNFNNDIMIIHANLLDNLEYCRVQDMQECFWKLVL